MVLQLSCPVCDIDFLSHRNINRRYYQCSHCHHIYKNPEYTEKPLGRPKKPAEV